MPATQGRALNARLLSLSVLVASIACASAGCQTWPEMVHEPQVRNPYPQLHKIAVAPFFNLSTEPTLDGRACALAYFNELQSIPGYEVVPIGVTEQTLRAYELALNSGEDVRKLAQILDVDAVVIGAITDYDAFYPPRYTLTAEWYAADPMMGEIISGYGLPLGAADENQIPSRLFYEAQLARARNALQAGAAAMPSATTPADMTSPRSAPGELPAPPQPEGMAVSQTTTLTGVAPVPGHPARQKMSGAGSAPRTPIAPDATAPTAAPATPVMRHTATFSGDDPAVVAALKLDSRIYEDERRDGWQGHLQRSEDFIRFCSRMHLQEMLSARGGADETRVTWRWSKRR